MARLAKLLRTLKKNKLNYFDPKWLG